MKATSEGVEIRNDNWWDVIRVIKTATALPELMFMARELGVPPLVVDSLYLGMGISKELKKINPKTNYALFDSNELLQIVEYTKRADLPSYMKANNFEVGYKILVKGAVPIKR